jgi:hypothetical protein
VDRGLGNVDMETIQVHHQGRIFLGDFPDGNIGIFNARQKVEYAKIPSRVTSYVTLVGDFLFMITFRQNSTE